MESEIILLMISVCKENTSEVAKASEVGINSSCLKKIILAESKA